MTKGECPVLGKVVPEMRVFRPKVGHEEQVIVVDSPLGLLPVSRRNLSPTCPLQRKEKGIFACGECKHYIAADIRISQT